MPPQTQDHTAKLLDRYRAECERNHLAQHERLQDNEFIHLVERWLNDWVYDAITQDDVGTADFQQRINAASDLKHRI